jgi:hypothetical protein
MQNSYNEEKYIFFILKLTAVYQFMNNYINMQYKLVISFNYFK